MYPITAALKPGDRGPEVLNLQLGLRLLLRRGRIAVPTEQRDELLQLLNDDIQARFYGTATSQIVAALQGRYSHTADGLVNHFVVNQLNYELERLGAFPTQFSFESTYAYLTEPSHNGGMEYGDVLRLLVALVSTPDGLPSEDRLAELAYHLNDEQRLWLQRLAVAANRLDDAAIATTISEEQFQAQRTRRFGASNPEVLDLPFWRFMVQQRWNAFQARMQFDLALRDYMNAYRARREREEAGETLDDLPEIVHPGYGAAVWCFDRFGMALTQLPDGRALFIAGEHEDSYDPDFCIYNDVIAIDSELRITIYAYPAEVFPPTDFHTATLVGNSDVYIIGNLGYQEERHPGETPIYRLDTTTMQISSVVTSGTKPGWISRHHSSYDPVSHTITVSGGQIVGNSRRGGRMRDNRNVYALDLTTMHWSRRRGMGSRDRG